MTAPVAQLHALIQRATELASTGKRELLGIAGAPGAGKSTLAAQLVAALGPQRAVLVPMDGFHLANVVLIERGIRNIKGAIETFDDAGYSNLLERIKKQQPLETIYAPYFDRDLEEPIAGAITVYANVPLIITEGNYLLSEKDSWSRARDALTESWYLEPNDDVRRLRLVHRHIAHGKTEDEARHWALGSDEQNANMIRATADRADRIIRVSSTS